MMTHGKEVFLLDKYKLVETLEYPNAIVRIHRPELSPEERSKRMKAIHDAAANLLANAIRDGTLKTNN